MAQKDVPFFAVTRFGGRVDDLCCSDDGGISDTHFAKLSKLISFRDFSNSALSLGAGRVVEHGNHGFALILDGWIFKYWPRRSLPLQAFSKSSHFPSPWRTGSLPYFVPKHWAPKLVRGPVRFCDSHSFVSYFSHL